MLNRVKKWFAPLQKYIDRPWYIPLVGLLACLDAVLVIFPIETLIAPAVLSRPRRWISATLWATFGSAAGALGLAALVQWDEAFIRGKLFHHLFHSHGWKHASDFVLAHGSLALGLIAAGPLPQQPAVAVAALAHMPFVQIGLAVLLGRLLKYALLSYLASHVPRLVEKASPEQK